MSGRPKEHKLVRELLFQRWAPYVRDTVVQQDEGYQTVEQVLMTYGGQPPDAGYPPEWPEETLLIEHEVVKLRREAKAVVLVEFGVVRDSDGYRLTREARHRAVHMGHTKYYRTLHGVLEALCHSSAIRDLLCCT